MSDVEKAIAGLVEDADYKNHQQDEQYQQTTSLAYNNKYNCNSAATTTQLNYNHLPKDTITTKGNSSNQQHSRLAHPPEEHQQLLHNHPQQQQQQHHHHHHHHHSQPKQQNQQHNHLHSNKDYYTATPTSATAGAANNKSASSRNCFSRCIKLIFSTPGLVVLVVCYTIMGALVFPLLEAPQDISKSAMIAKSREDCLKELWIITEKLNVLYERNWTMLVHEQLRRFEGTIVAATRNMPPNSIASFGGALAAASGDSSGLVAGAAGSNSGAFATSGTTNAGGYKSYAETTATQQHAMTSAMGRHGISGSSSSSSGSNSNPNFNNINNNLAMEYNEFTTTKWSFSEALLYSVTVITTIGHGSLTPRTAGGKIATIFYALIGVPLMLMCLSSLGALLAEALQCTYARLCCRWQYYQENDANDNETATDEDELNVDEEDDVDKGGGGGGVAAGRKSLKKQKRQHHYRHQQHPAENVLTSDEREHHFHHHEAKQHLYDSEYKEHNHQHNQKINCKNSKYDNLIGLQQSSPLSQKHNNDDDLAYKLKAHDDAICDDAVKNSSCTMDHYQEESCKLLQNSPMKLKHGQQYNTMPINKVGAAAAAGGCMQQQSFYQQRPDIMTMTTGQKMSLNTPSPPPAGPMSSLGVAIPTQARFFQTTPQLGAVSGTPAAAAPPPLTTYHFVTSASANSSPTHQQTIKHYILPQTQTQQLGGTAATAGQQQQQQQPFVQHFMAVPSNLLRFQSPSTAAGSYTSNTNININPLALSLNSSATTATVGNGASATATIYLPLLAPSSSNQSSSVQQPFIKYHTLQMPHRRTYSLALDNSGNSSNAINEPPLNAATNETLPPPPPAYQTATVHGIRRAKYLTKPLPQEINTLLHENDISCRHDLSQNTQNYTLATGAAAEGAGGGGCLAGNSNEATGIAESEQPFASNVQQQQPALTSAVGTTSTSHSVILSTSVEQTTLTTQTSTATATAAAALATSQGTSLPTVALLPAIVTTTKSMPTAVLAQYQQQQQQHLPTSQQRNNSYNNTNSNTIISNDFNHCIASSISSASTCKSRNTNNSNASNTNTINICEQQYNDLLPTTSTLNPLTHSINRGVAGAVAAATMNTSQYALNSGCTTTQAADIMEDDDEQRMGTCPYGTPSRQPLLTNTSGSCSSTNETADKANKRNFLNATAASFHRHTLNTFQRSTAATNACNINRKSIIINRKGECNIHIPRTRSNSISAGTLCYKDNANTSEDDAETADIYRDEAYKLKPIAKEATTKIKKCNKNKCYHDATCEDCLDQLSLVSYCDSVSSSQAELPQVPMLLVLFILTFYVCMGTVIFALWENWSLIDGAYFCFVTLTTIGYGDFVPLQTFQGPEIQLFACCAYLLLGLVLVAMSFSILETQLIWKCRRLAVRLKLAKE